MRETKTAPMAVWLGLMSLVMDHKSTAQTLLEDEMGLPWSRFRALRRVEDHDFTQRELAERMHVDAPAMSTIINDLVAHGYVERVPHPDDGRAKLIRITAAGSALMERLRNLPGAIPPPVAHLSAAQRGQLAVLVDAMRASAESATEVTP